MCYIFQYYTLVHYLKEDKLNQGAKGCLYYIRYGRKMPYLALVLGGNVTQPAGASYGDRYERLVCIMQSCNAMQGCTHAQAPLAARRDRDVRTGAGL